MTHVGASKEQTLRNLRGRGLRALSGTTCGDVGLGGEFPIPKLEGIFFKVKMKTESLFRTSYSIMEPLPCDN